MKIVIEPDNSFRIFSNRGRVLHHSRCFRLRVQAEEQARLWVEHRTHPQPVNEGITLQVDDVSVDPDSLFGGM